MNFNKDMPGYGWLNYNESLVLTCEGQYNRSLWKLPQILHPNYNTKMTFHEKLVTKKGEPIWQLKDNYCLLQSVGRGQEFVISGNVEVEECVKEILKNSID